MMGRMNKVYFKTTDNDRELQQILVLQEQNVEGSRSQRIGVEDGFVTVRHDLNLLRSMGRTSPHIIAVADQKVIAYALVMRRQFAAEIPVLAPLFSRLERLRYQGMPLADQRYFVMGQICVATEFRGQGVFSGLYRTMSSYYAERFQFVVTEIAARNGRSRAAHQKVGFQTLDHYTDPSETWDIVIWDWCKGMAADDFTTSK